MLRDGAFAVVLIAAPARHDAAGEAVRAAGGHVAAAIGWDGHVDLPRHLAGAPVLLVEASDVDDAALDAALPGIAQAIEANGLRAVVSFDPAQLDAIAAGLLMPDVDLLCAASIAQLAAALATARQISAAPGLHDRVREQDGERHHQIAAEVARITTLLFDLADRDHGADNIVGDRRMAFHIERLDAAVDPQTVRRAIRARRLRDAFFGENLFEDPAWDMLLDLYAARLEGRQVSVSSLCIASAVAATTALRWIGRLTEAGMFDRQPDPQDRRRAFIGLSARAMAGMEGYAVALRRAGLSFA